MVDKHKWQGGKRTRDGPNQTGDEEHIAYAEFELGGSTYR
ncbi:potassium transporter peripheral membrane component [Vibrio alginolyticus 12G01]|nr:potassium transporter peripheral membrane component [Vibrio alginolyticus 12G01]